MRLPYSSATSATIAPVNFARTRLISRPNPKSREIEEGCFNKYPNKRA